MWAWEPIVALIVALVAATLCGLSLHPQGFVLAIGLATLVVVGTAWPWLTVCGLDGTVAFDKSRAREGEPIHVWLILRNCVPWGSWGLKVHVGSGDDRDAGVGHLGGWQRAMIAWNLLPDRRGLYPACPPGIANGFPFGLLAASPERATSNELVV